LRFEHPTGFEFLLVGLAEINEGVRIVTRQDDGLAGETVLEGIQRCAALAFGSFGAGGIFRVFAVDGGPFDR
jgi:hypothetical protein